MFGFGFGEPVCAFGFRGEGRGHLVGERTVGGDAAYHADAETEVSEADEGGGEVVNCLEDVG